MRCLKIEVFKNLNLQKLKSSKLDVFKNWSRQNLKSWKIEGFTIQKIRFLQTEVLKILTLQLIESSKVKGFITDLFNKLTNLKLPTMLFTHLKEHCTFILIFKIIELKSLLLRSSSYYNWKVLFSDSQLVSLAKRVKVWKKSKTQKLRLTTLMLISRSH